VQPHDRLEAIFLRHQNVCDNHIGRRLSHDRGRFFPVGRGHHLVTRPQEYLGERNTQRQVVVDDKNRCHYGRSLCLWSGNRSYEDCCIFIPTDEFPVAPKIFVQNWRIRLEYGPRARKSRRAGGRHRDAPLARRNARFGLGLRGVPVGTVPRPALHRHPRFFLESGEPQRVAGIGVCPRGRVPTLFGLPEATLSVRRETSTVW